MATPTLESLARHFTKGIYIGIRPNLAPLVSGLEAGRNIIPCPKPKTLPSLFKEARKLRKLELDGALLLTRSIETALVAWLARIPFRAGLLDHRFFLITHGFKEPPRKRIKGKEPKRIPRYMGDLYRDLARILNVKVEDSKPVLKVTPEEREKAERILENLGIGRTAPYFLANPGASYGASKLWPPEFMAIACREIGRALGKKGIVLSGPSQKEQEMATAIARTAGGDVLVPAVGENFIDLGALKHIVGNSILLITTDSGPRHMAVAFSVPHVVLMGPTDPRFTAKHTDNAVILRKDVECGPCHYKECPYEHHKCMRGIKPEEVVEAASNLVENRSSE